MSLFNAVETGSGRAGRCQSPSISTARTCRFRSKPVPVVANTDHQWKPSVLVRARVFDHLLSYQSGHDQCPEVARGRGQRGGPVGSHQCQRHGHDQRRHGAGSDRRGELCARHDLHDPHRGRRVHRRLLGQRDREPRLPGSVTRLRCQQRLSDDDPQHPGFRQCRPHPEPDRHQAAYAGCFR